MQGCRRFVLIAVSAILLLQVPTPGGAQHRATTTVEITPSGGLGPIIDHGNLVSWSANLLVEVAVTRSHSRWSLFSSVRGFGAACADSCDLSGEGVGLGVERLVGGVGIGGGLGVLRQSGAWYWQPVATISVSRGLLRTQLRVETPQGGFGVNMPLLVGVRLPVR